MPKLIVTMEGAATREFALTKARTLLGRRPYNDVVLDNLAVSGEHAVMNMSAGQVEVEDLGSTNGTYVNGAAVQKQWLKDGDQLDIGKFKIRFENDAAPPEALQAAIVLTSGVGAGREMRLTKEATRIGKPGVAVAVIARRAHKFWLHCEAGTGALTLNGAAVGTEPTLLHAGDQIVLAGTQMQFVQI